MSTPKSEAFFSSSSRPSGFRDKGSSASRLTLFAFAILAEDGLFPGSDFPKRPSEDAVLQTGLLSRRATGKTRQNQTGTFEKASRGGYSERVGSPDRGDHRAQSQTRYRPDYRVGKRQSCPRRRGHHEHAQRACRHRYRLLYPARGAAVPSVSRVAFLWNPDNASHAPHLKELQ